LIHRGVSPGVKQCGSIKRWRSFEYRDLKPPYNNISDTFWQRAKSFDAVADAFDKMPLQWLLEVR
jgi:hypothetical protein